MNARDTAYLTEPLPCRSTPGRVSAFFLFLTAVLMIMAPMNLRGSGSANEKKPLVALVIKKKFSAHQKTAEGIKDAIGKAKISCRFAIYDSSKGLNIAVRMLRIRKPALIICAGFEASQQIGRALPDTPVLYTLALPPGRTRGGARRLVGSALNVPASIQMQILKRVAPNIKKVGIAYNPEENSNLVAEARKTIEKIGLTLVTFPVKSPEEIPNLVKMKVDAYWLVPDLTASRFPIFKRLAQDALKMKIPLMVFSRYHVKSGGLVSVSYDYYDIGNQTGELAVRFLKGVPYANLEGTTPRKYKLFLNLWVAKQLGLNIPDKIKQQAAEVFE